MNKGEPVLVRDYRGRFVQRIVWDQFGTSIVVCRASDYENWTQTGWEPKLTGFPYEDITLVAEE